ncbi:outer membrane protein assembly factor BamB [Rubricella aquisinus]|uniref:Outer membrane protein assembly factor BamB n=1 Tax=Rubricella aquisinus TaxID=2028108 RepID=A0A840WS62_9RHOB|nr:PQQ-like beta-propeller repeat protein [Rubricella aquisinus]MBB5516502.1 outer membrane protein assembly factor BamB [Rubricella aquisinus]
MTVARIAAIALIATAVLTACSDEEERLPGEREPIRISAAQTAAVNGAAPSGFGPSTQNTQWTHSGGAADGMGGHPALDAVLTQVWAVQVGSRPVEDLSITAEPIVAGGRVFTLDANGTVAATAETGGLLWSISLVPEGEEAEAGFGGGLAYSDNRVFVTTGFGQVTALDPANGGILWQEQFDSPFRAAPVADRNRVVVVTRTDLAVALDAGTGRTVWQFQGSKGAEGIASSAAPVLSDGIALVPFSAGEVLAIVARNGRRLWSFAVSDGRRGLARGSIGEITGAPVVQDARVYLGNQTGSIVAIEGAGGRESWRQADGAMDRAAVLGGSVYVITDRAVLLRMDAQTGRIIWSRPLDELLPDGETRVVYHGPVIAGGRLLVATEHGPVLSVSAEDGTLSTALTIPDGAASSPAIANGRLYILSNAGVLHAFE